jgi:hypothetical protein
MANSTKWIVFIEHRKDHDNMPMVLEMLDGYIYMNMQFAATGCYMYSFKNLLLKKLLNKECVAKNMEDFLIFNTQFAYRKFA